MVVAICFAGAIIGWILKMIINKLSDGLLKDKKKYWTSKNNSAILICMVLFLISFLKIGLNIKFIEVSILSCILIIISFVDIEYRIIPDKIILFLFAMGISFCLLGCISVKGAFYGMLFGGGIILLLALISPGAIGGGDIKMMFAIGLILGTYKVIAALFLSFILAAVISVFLLLFRIKGRKDYIPFGPFLSLGSFIAFNFFI